MNAGPARPIPQTPRLRLREMTPADLPEMAALLGDPEVMRHYPRVKTRDEALDWIHWNQDLYRAHGHGLWLVTLRDTGEFVGDCGLTPQPVDGTTEIEIGYHVRADRQGHGYATEAATACRDFARDALALDRIVAIIDPGNIASQRVAGKIGLARERRIIRPETGRDVLIFAGRP